MDLVKRIHRCYHCGAVLQTESELEPGYITEAIMKMYPEGFLLCNNCYRRDKFSQAPANVDFDQEYLSILQKAKSSNSS